MIRFFLSFSFSLYVRFVMHVVSPGIRGFVLQTGLTRQRAPIVDRVPLLLKRRFLESRWLVEFVRNERLDACFFLDGLSFSRRAVACYGRRRTKIAATILQGRLAIDIMGDRMKACVERRLACIALRTAVQNSKRLVGEEKEKKKKKRKKKRNRKPTTKAVPSVTKKPSGMI